MELHYVYKGEKCGPKSVAEMHELEAQGVIGDATLVWHSDLEDWTSWQQIKLTLDAASEPVGQKVSGEDGECTTCGETFPAEQLVVFGEDRVCAGCKPAYVQALKENVGKPRKKRKKRGQVNKVWCVGRDIMAMDNAILPDRCVLCNEPSTRPPKKRTFRWHHPALYILIIACNLVIYAIVALIVQKKATVSFCLCEQHHRRHLMGMMIGWVGALTALGLMFGGCVSSNSDAGGMILLVGIVGLLVSLIVGTLMTRSLSPRKIENGVATLKGAHPGFLATLPLSQYSRDEND